MRNTGLPLSLIALALLIPGFWLLADWRLNPPINRVNYEKIRVGMTSKEVERILAPRPMGSGWQTHERDKMQAEDQPFEWPMSHVSSFYNITRRIDVYFDSDYRVKGKAYYRQMDTLGIGTIIDRLPLWSILLAEAIGLLIVAYLGFRWIKKYLRRSRLYTPSVAIPAFLSQDDDF